MQSPPLTDFAGLMAEALESLERVGCQFDHCDGPTTKPVDMVTCHVCETIARLRVALGRPARLPEETTAAERIDANHAAYMRRATAKPAVGTTAVGTTALITMGIR